MSWFYAFEDSPKGPVEETEFRRLISAGVIQPDTLVWREGAPAWLPLEQVWTNERPEVASGRLCDACLQIFPEEQLAAIRECRICAACKPAVLHRFQENGRLPEPNDPRRHGPAWEGRKTLGWRQAAWATVRDVLQRPGHAFDTMRRSGGHQSPLLFLLLVKGVGSSFFVIYWTIAQVAFRNRFPILAGGFGHLSTSLFILMAVFRLVSSLVMLPVGAYVSSGFLHLGLLLCGGARRPFETTFRATCYSTSSISMLQVVPVLGTIASFPWSVVVAPLALARSHETERWRAYFAFLFPLAVLLIPVSIFFVLIGFAAAAATH